MLCAKHQPHLDASTTVDEDDWYLAARDWGSLDKFCRRFSAERNLFCVDVYSVSKRIANTFTSHGFAAAAFDIKSNPLHDITTRAGFLILLELALK